MKFAVISPGHKKGDNLIRVSYRPITVLSNCLYYKKCMKQSWTTNYLDISWRNSMIFSASLKRYSCQNLLLKAIDDRKCALDQNLITGVVFMDWSKAFDCLPHSLSITKLHPYGVHPCEKVIGMFFQNQIWSRLLDINILRLACIKRATEEVKKCQISKRGYQQGLSDETLKKALCQFCHVKFDHRIMEGVGFFDDEIRIFTGDTFNFMKRWSKCVVSWFSDIVRLKWYFRKLHTIK